MTLFPIRERNRQDFHIHLLAGDILQNISNFPLSKIISFEFVAKKN